MLHISHKSKPVKKFLAIPEKRVLGVTPLRLFKIMDKIFIMKIFINIVLLSILIKVVIDLNGLRNYCMSHQPIDYVLKEEFDKCYLTVHNFISLNSTLVQHKNDSNINFNNYSQKFYTYISSFTKPFLLELVHNSTEDCLCCS